LPPTEWMNLARVLRELKMEQVGCMPPSAVKAMTDAIPDQMMADIVREQRRGLSAPSSIAGPGEPRPAPVRGSGWDKARPLEGPSGLRYVDQQIDTQDMIDKRDLARRLGGG
jgi:hypothetical protein